MSTPAVAVTGGIASGKSAVCSAFQALGRSVLDADEVARELVEPGQLALAEIVERFGGDVLQQDGRLDRAGLRARVFADPAARRQLESILHPRIRQTLRQRAAAAAGPYSLVAVPLLVESQDYGWVSRVLLVDVPESMQLSRVMRRDGVDATQARAVLAAQASRQARWAIATDVIINDGTLDDLRAPVEALDRLWCERLRR